MKKKRYKKGDLVGNHFVFIKEVIPHYYDSGRRKSRRAFFRCVSHKDVYFKLTFHNALRYSHTFCPCKDEKTYDLQDVEDYSFQTEDGWHRKALREAPAEWFRVTRMGIFHLFQQHILSLP